MQVLRRTLIPASRIGDNAITEGKLSEHHEHGTVSGVTLGGRYRVYDVAFAGTPDTVIAGAGSLAQAITRRTSGSFQIKLNAAGTAEVMYDAWGPR